MTEDFLSKSYIDHFLQADILLKLSNADAPVRFSDLKDDGVDNSLFMYHANKLIDRGVIEKQDAGFALTQKGARWANFAGINHSFQIMTPRPLIQFLVHGPGDTILIAQRRGQLKSLLNGRLLPGGIYPYGHTMAENAAAMAKKLFESEAIPPLLTIADVMHSYADGFVSHVITYIFEVTVDSADKAHAVNSFDVEWVKLSDITFDNPLFETSTFIPLFIERLKTLKPNETFLIES